MLRRVVLEGGANARGRRHGETFAEEIRAYAAERVRLAGIGGWSARRRTDVIALAERMIPAHRAYPALFDEMAAMAGAAGISVAEAIVTGGFTDFVDAVRALGGRPLEEDDCTAVLVPDHRAEGAGFLAQTWDMHDTATPHVALLDLHPDDAPAALLFTTVGCVGQIGLNAAGLAVGITNLTASDGRVGVTWPFVVREALAQTSLEAALECVLRADLAGGHTYLLLDATGAGAEVEAMPTHRAVRRLEGDVLVHTNHVLDPEAKKREAERPADLVASSVTRLESASTSLKDGPIDADRLVALTRDPAICRRSEPPHHMETSGAVVLRPRTREVWAVAGIPADNAYERFVVG